jgi:hypothetical protein
VLSVFNWQCSSAADEVCGWVVSALTGGRERPQRTQVERLEYEVPSRILQSRARTSVPVDGQAR